ncbi:MAG: hypothetical protein V1738_06525 [Patescibacteria group bacterium]
MHFPRVNKSALMIMVFLTCFAVVDLFVPTKNSGISVYETVVSPTLVEYVFDSGDDSDLGFTKRAYIKINSERTMLDFGSAPIDSHDMTFVRLNEPEHRTGIVERRAWGDDVYELKQTTLGAITDQYVMFLNGSKLFSEKMSFGASGPILDWRIVDEKPAFTFTSGCSLDNNNRVTCTSDIWHDGGLVSKKFNVDNPRYLFTYDGKFGFVASVDNQDVIYFDHQIITPGYDTIWTHNCCSYTEILPTVHENGTLLFYAIRDHKNYLVETELK